MGNLQAAHDKKRFGRKASTLHVAAEQGHLKVVMLLLNHIADKVALNDQDKDGKTPLFSASRGLQCCRHSTGGQRNCCAIGTVHSSTISVADSLALPDLVAQELFCGTLGKASSRIPHILWGFWQSKL